MMQGELIHLAEDKIRKLEKINAVLMGRVERSMDFTGSAFSLFQTAILLDGKVKARTRDLESTLTNLSEAYGRLGEARDEAEKAKQNLTAAIEAVSEGFALFDHNECLVLCNAPFRGLFPELSNLLKPGLHFSTVAALFSRNHSLILESSQTPAEWAQHRIHIFRQPYSSFIQQFSGDRWIQISNRRMETGATVISQTDITDMVRSERVRHERELDEQSRLLQATIDHLPQGIAMFAPDMTLRAWNRSFVNLLLLPLRQVFHGTALNSLFDYLRNSQFRLGETAIQKLRRWVHEPTASDLHQIELQRADGIILELQSHAMPDHGVVITFTDVTSDKRYTLALREAKETLEQRVEERTHALTREVMERREIERELVKAKEIAEAANKGKTQFFAAASHDLLQPLNAARLFLSLLMESRLDPRDIRLVENTDKAFGSVEQLLDSLLDISRFESGSIAPNISRFPLDELLAILSAEFRPMAARKGLELIAMPTAFWVESDKALLRRIVQNFLSNAVRYTDKGKILLGVRRRADTVSIEVWDTGRGVPPGKTNLIFREFTRLDNEDPAEPHAMGLGLAIVDRVANLLGHNVNMRSTFGSGSCFSIEVPNVAPLWRQLPQDEPAVTASARAGLSILVIENDLAILEGMVGLLESRGLKPVPTVSIEEALEASESLSSPPELIIADYHLDRGTGLDAINALRQRLGSVIPAIIVTADHSQELRDRLNAQSIALLWKPVKAEALFAQIARR